MSGRDTSEPTGAYQEGLAHRSSRVTLLGGLSSYPSRRPSPSQLYRPERPEAHPRSFRPSGVRCHPPWLPPSPVSSIPSTRLSSNRTVESDEPAVHHGYGVILECNSARRGR